VNPEEPSTSPQMIEVYATVWPCDHLLGELTRRGVDARSDASGSEMAGNTWRQKVRIFVPQHQVEQARAVVDELARTTTPEQIAQERILAGQAIAAVPWGILVGLVAGVLRRSVVFGVVVAGAAWVLSLVLISATRKDRK
jgi:hypothetical protein